MSGDIEYLITFAAVFVALFFIGGIAGAYCFPQVPGIFYIAGLLFAIFGTGAGSLIIKIIWGR